jgi:hypothetical protein
MTEPKSKADKEAGNLSEGAKTHLVDVFVSNRYGRHKDLHNKYLSKGNEVEEDSITLYSRVHFNYFKKNDESLSNDFIKGTPDLYLGESVKNAELVIDIKSSWDIDTFFRVLTKGVNDLYWWQLQGYMQLTGAKSAKLAYCLVDTPEHLIYQELKMMCFSRLGFFDMDKKECQDMEEYLTKNMTFSDIKKEERVIEFDIERDDAEVAKLYKRIEKAREFLIELEEQIETKSRLFEASSIISQTNPIK